MSWVKVELTGQAAMGKWVAVPPHQPFPPRPSHAHTHIKGRSLTVFAARKAVQLGELLFAPVWISPLSHLGFRGDEGWHALVDHNFLRACLNVTCPFQQLLCFGADLRAFVAFRPPSPSTPPVWVGQLFRDEFIRQPIKQDQLEFLREN